MTLNSPSDYTEFVNLWKINSQWAYSDNLKWSFSRLSKPKLSCLYFDISCFAVKVIFDYFKAVIDDLTLFTYQVQVPKESCFQKICKRERESLLAQTLNNFIQIKAKALGHRKKPVKQVVSSGAHRQFHKFLSWFKVDGRIIANLIRLLFWRGCSLLDDQHSCAGVLGRNRYPSWFAQFRKELSMAEKV